MTANTDFLIIGAGAAATTAAQTIRSLKTDSKITLITDENYEWYSRVLLSRYIRGEISRDQVFLKKPQWYAENKIELVKNISAQKLLPNEKTVVFANGDRFKYQKLLIAIGAHPIKLNVEGSNLQNISYMWTLDDANRIIKAISEGKHGLVIGGGFIGLEFVHCFKAKGLDVVILEGSDHYWGNRLDLASGKVLQNVLEKSGIEVITGDLVEKFIGKNDDMGKVGGAVTKSGRQMEADLVGIGIGIKSDLAWLEGSGLEIDQGIVTNEFLETNIGDVYAAGDCCEFYDVIINAPHLVGTWTNATTQGSTVARTICGARTVFEAVSVYTVNFFGASVSFIGMTEADFADEVISRGSVESDRMTQIFVKTIDNVTRIVGATAINAADEVATISAVIKNRTDISQSKTKLADVSFDLKNLVS